jgi:hypothetical protein
MQHPVQRCNLNISFLLILVEKEKVSWELLNQRLDDRIAVGPIIESFQKEIFYMIVSVEKDSKYRWIASWRRRKSRKIHQQKIRDVDWFNRLPCSVTHFQGAETVHGEYCRLQNV